MGDQVKARAERVIAEHVTDDPGMPDAGYCEDCGQPWPCAELVLARNVLGLLDELHKERACHDCREYRALLIDENARLRGALRYAAFALKDYGDARCRDAYSQVEKALEAR